MAMIYTIDEEDDWKSEEVWKKANPSWPILNQIDFRDDAQAAIDFAHHETNFKNLRLNVWTDAPSVWIKADDWTAGKHPVRSEEELASIPCYGGMDFAAVKDLTSLVLNFPMGDGTRHIKCWFWIPEKKVREKEDRVDYWVWKKQGHIRVIQGDAINHRELAHEVKQILDKFNVRGLTYDKYGIGEAVIQILLDDGFPVNNLHPLKQVATMFEPGISKIEEEISFQKINHENNPILKWNIANTVIHQSATGARGLDKKKSTQRIDGTAALVMSIVEEINAEPEFVPKARFV